MVCLWEKFTNYLPKSSPPYCLLSVAFEYFCVAVIKHTPNKNKNQPLTKTGLLAGAEGLEPSARGFGATVESSKSHR